MESEDFDGLIEDEETCDWGILIPEDFANLTGLEVIRFMDCETEIHRLAFIKEFFNCELDLCKTSEQLEISVPTLIRILSQEYVSINYGPVVSEYVKHAIAQYKVEFEENKEKNKQYQINTYMSVPVTRFEKK